MIREINAASALCALAVGSAFNVTLVWLIWRKSPAEMRVYSRILLQTCGADLLMLLATAMTQPIYATDNGVGIVMLNGPLGWDLFDFVPDNLSLFLWDNCFFFAFFGFAAQFVYRYLILNRNAKISTKQYFAALCGIVCPLDFVLALALFRTGHPDPGSDLCCQNQVVVRILQNGQQHLAQRAGDSYSFAWLAVTVCITIAYAIIFFCTFSMRRYVRENLKTGGGGYERAGEINQQLTLNMIIQSLLPLLTLLPVWVTLINSVTNANTHSDNSFLLELMMLIRLPVHWTPVLNPVVTMLTVKHYRRALRRLFRRAVGQDVSLSVPASENVRTPAAAQHSIVVVQSPTKHTFNNNFMPHLPAVA